MDVEGIMERIPHRYPFLLLDGILRCKPGETITAVKNVSFNEPYFLGHFPGHPVMPGVLIVETMAQAAGVLIWESVPPDERDFTLYLVAVEKARFRRPVRPGDRLAVSATLTSRRRNFWRFDAVAEVDGTRVASSEFVQTPGLPR
ncbi:MAG: 3-hydroxyacyl-ACP dehydratase FabZ [Proteobacteria bacterium]|nr:3-hydroxyacyl-ACP dehydratase FabZ [Pseudomonadota bacterium]MYJ96172.1 3-hydroxyacyl-ACP dehydratase FabZ [Pseudomonadota bacterium]